ncbi:MAG: hypothetical protein RIC95_02025 [Vicingaceae bacterium]
MNRKTFLSYSALGMLSISTIPLQSFTQEVQTSERYPQLLSDQVLEAVSFAHFQHDKLKRMLQKRSELAKATWDWGFGDFESAIEAASHVARFDIIDLLLAHGARPNLFTYCTLGNFELVKSVLHFSPELSKTRGPHGISLLQHAKNGQLHRGSNKEKEAYRPLIAFLTKIEGEEPSEVELSSEQKEPYLGNYRYGNSDFQSFSVKQNLKGKLTFGKVGTFGGALTYLGNDRFIYSGAPQVKLHFIKEKQHVKALILKDAGLTVRAEKVSE